MNAIERLLYTTECCGLLQGNSNWNKYDCNHSLYIMSMLAPWKESYDKCRQHIKKQRHPPADKGPYRQTWGFSSSHVQIWKLDHKEGWALRNWCSWIVAQGTELRVPWTAKRSNQSILKEINPEHSLEGLMLKLKLQYFGHLMHRADSCKKTLILRKIEGRRRRGWQRMR